MLPNIIIGRYLKDSELVDWGTFRTIESKRQETVSRGKSNPNRYNKYEQETNLVGRLKKLKEFLCTESETAPIEGLMIVNGNRKEKENQCHTSRQTTRKKFDELPLFEKAETLTRELPCNSMSRQRMRLRQLIPRNSQSELPELSKTSKLSERIKLFKIL